MRCPICGGSGTIQYDQDKNFTIVCGSCFGSGKLDIGETKPELHYGSNWEITDEKWECPAHDVVINIFDIDGCIMKDVFSNKELNIEDIKRTRKLLADIEPYPSFINYYKTKCSEDNVIQNIFLTGRREKDYGEITRNQLKKVDKIYIAVHFYPKNLRHIPEDYFPWKVKKIEELVSFFVKVNKDFDEIYEEKTKVIVNVYDDLNRYFKDLKSSKDHKYNCFHIRKEKDWNEI